MGGAEGEREGGGSIRMTAGCAGGAVDDLAGVGDGAVEGVEVFADIAAGRDLEFAVFKRGAEAWKKFGFEGGGELAKLEVNAGAGVVGVFVIGFGEDQAGAEFFGEAVAEADAGPGVVDGDGAAAAEAREEDFELIGRGEVVEAEDLSC
jgi:hypothetical protein